MDFIVLLFVGEFFGVEFFVLFIFVDFEFFFFFVEVIGMLDVNIVVWFVLFECLIFCLFESLFLGFWLLECLLSCEEVFEIVIIVFILVLLWFELLDILAMVNFGEFFFIIGEVWFLFNLVWNVGFDLDKNIIVIKIYRI